MKLVTLKIVVFILSMNLAGCSLEKKEEHSGSSSEAEEDEDNDKDKRKYSHSDNIKADDKKPTDGTQGVPGYLVHPDLISVFNNEDGNVEVEAKAGSFKSYSVDNPRVLVSFWAVPESQFEATGTVIDAPSNEFLPDADPNEITLKEAIELKTAVTNEDGSLKTKFPFNYDLSKYRLVITSNKVENNEIDLKREDSKTEVVSTKVPAPKPSEYPEPPTRPVPSVINQFQVYIYSPVADERVIVTDGHGTIIYRSLEIKDRSVVIKLVGKIGERVTFRRSSAEYGGVTLGFIETLAIRPVGLKPLSLPPVSTD